MSPERSTRAALLAVFLLVAPAAAAVARGHDVTFAIDMRGPIREGWFDPKTERVGLRGGVPPLSWASTAEAADRDGDGIFELKLSFDRGLPPGGLVTYKLKVDGSDNPNDGWETGANHPLVLARGPVTVARAFNDPPAPYPSTLTGALRTHPDFASRFVPSRDIHVLLPPGYERASGRRYPVLYMHDGQRVFDAAVSQGGEWRMDEALDRLARRGLIEPVIIVSIPSIDATRIDEYTPTHVERTEGGRQLDAGGKARLYGRFLVEELKPFVDRTYRTKPGPSDTGLGGSSLGGLVTMFLGLEHPGTFGKLIVASPSVWWDGEAILERVQSASVRTRQRIWLDIGTAEGDEALRGARRLRDALVARGWRQGSDLAYVEARGAGHDEAAWASRSEAMLRFLFPPGAGRRRTR